MGTSASSPYTCGYRVLDVQPNSPGLQAGLVSFFDFIMKAEEQTFETEGNALVNVLARYKGRRLPLVVYNTKSGTYREVSIVPSDTWGGDGLLGITIRHDSYQTSSESNSIRVLDVVPGSPADEAGLTPEIDYILGTAAHTFSDSSELFEIVLDHLDKVLDIYVYNSSTDRVSLKRLRPNNNWGGEGCLGLDVGQGYLHSIPSECRKTNGVACSLVTSPLSARNPQVPNTVIDPLATAPRPAAAAAPMRTPAPAPLPIPAVRTSARASREAKMSRRAEYSKAAAATVGPAASTTAMQSAAGVNIAGVPTVKSVTPAKLPLAATLSPPESKRTAGSKTPR